MIFPQRCFICGGKSSRLLCNDCISKLDVGFNRCLVCSRPVVSKRSLCLNCLKYNNYFSKGFSLFNYRDGISNKIVELIKFHGYARAVNIISLFSSAVVSSEVFKNADCLIPVPMHRLDIKRRGFNQSVLIAKELSKIVGIKVCFDCVCKIKLTQPQVGLDAQSRKKNLKGAFRLLKKPVSAKKVVIVDDVFTTGSTVNEICKLFKGEGVDCAFFTIAATPQE